MSGSTCHDCGRGHDELPRDPGRGGLTYAGDKMLCAECYDAAKAANQQRDDVPPCVECGAELVRRPEEHPPLNGSYFLDCLACDRTHIAFVGEPVRPWHPHQPKCECGQYARYRGRPTVFGRRSKDEVWTYHCRGCGRHLEVRTDRPRFDLPLGEQNLRPPRVRVTREPS